MGYLLIFNILGGLVCRYYYDDTIVIALRIMITKFELIFIKIGLSTLNGYLQLSA